MTALQPLIGSRILLLREQRVMLDADLAELYGVQTKVLVQAVKRNRVRFPQDFMLQLSADEFAALRSQSVTSNTGGRGGRRTAPYAFTEQGEPQIPAEPGHARTLHYGSAHNQLAANPALIAGRACRRRERRAWWLRRGPHRVTGTAAAWIQARTDRMTIFNPTSLPHAPPPPDRHARSSPRACPWARARPNRPRRGRR